MCWPHVAVGLYSCSTYIHMHIKVWQVNTTPLSATISTTHSQLTSSLVLPTPPLVLYTSLLSAYPLRVYSPFPSASPVRTHYWYR